MKRALSLSGIVLTCVALMGAAPHGAEPKQKPPADPPGLSEPHRQTLKGFVYFYVTTRANFRNLVTKIHPLVPQVKKAVQESHAERAGGLVLIYHGATTDQSKDFDLEVGYPIVEKVRPAGEFKVRELGDYPCLSLLYTGPSATISRAFEKLLPAATAGAGKPTDEQREMYLYFESSESPNNVFHVSVGMK